MYSPRPKSDGAGESLATVARHDVAHPANWAHHPGRMRRSKRTGSSCFRRIGLVALLVAGVPFVGCERRPSAGAETDGPLEFDGDTQGLLLTWLDAHGGAHVATRPSEVPVEARGFVRVLVAATERGAFDPILVADLDAPSDGARFVARPLPRTSWEEEIAKRRGGPRASGTDRSAAPSESEHGSSPGRPTPGSPAPLDPAPRERPERPSTERSDIDVTVYGASWCGPCHEALAHLEKRGIRARFRDVEREPGAGREMRQKLARAGRRGGNIPVIDVAGRVLVGFSPSVLDEALATVAGGTAL